MIFTCKKCGSTNYRIETKGTTTEQTVGEEQKVEIPVEVTPLQQETDNEILYVYYKEYKDNTDKYEKAGEYNRETKRMPVRLKKIEE